MDTYTNQPEQATRASDRPSSVSNKAAILAIIMVSYVMIVLDISIVITGLPKIHRELGFTDAGLSWVSNAYTLTFGGFLLLGARAGDILGRRQMLIAGLVLFTAASVAIGFAQSPTWLVAARATQGIGAAILAPSTLALLQTTFSEPRERVRAVAMYASAAGIAASVGLVLGGLLADGLSWRAGFFINLPIGSGLIIAARRYIAETPAHADTFDLAGALSSTAGMSAVVFGVVTSASAGWASPLTLGALVLGIVLLAIFVWVESRARHPIMPLRLFDSRERAIAYAARVLFLGANVGFFFFLTQQLQDVMHYSPARTGLAFLPAMVVNFGMALMVPRLVQRFGNAKVLAASVTVSLLGIAWLTRITPETSFLVGLLLPMLMVGAGQGGALAPLTTFGINGVVAADAGAASGLVNAAHQMGSSVGLGVLIAASAIGVSGLSGPELLTSRIDHAMTAAAVMLGLALCLVLPLLKSSKDAIA